MRGPTREQLRQVLYDFASRYLNGADSLERGRIADEDAQRIQALYAGAAEKAEMGASMMSLLAVVEAARRVERLERDSEHPAWDDLTNALAALEKSA